MPKRKLNGPLKVLAYLSTVTEEITLYRIQKDLDMRFDTLDRAINILKEAGFIKERIETGPPVRRLVCLTDKGREAALCARRILELAGKL